MAIFKRKKNKKINSTPASGGGMSIGQGAMSVAPPARINTSNVRRDIAPEEMGYIPTNTSYTSSSATGTGSFNTSGISNTIERQLTAMQNPSSDFNSLQKAVDDAYRVNKPYYDELRKYKMGGFQDYLKQTQEGLDMSLADLEQNFEEDRLAADVQEAQRGTLFSTGRRERRQSMQDKYQRQADSKRLQAEGALRGAARDFEYQMGADALDGMNMKLGSTRFDAGGTRPTTSRRLTRAYRPEGYAGDITRNQFGDVQRDTNDKFFGRINDRYAGY